MKNLIIKKNLTICGSGGGGGGGGSAPPPPPPPVITQYPGVLAPPQMGQLNSISSFSYAEMIDLLSDGPIDGLVNKFGKKVYDENILEGIYLNDTAIKETSITKSFNFPLDKSIAPNKSFFDILISHFSNADSSEVVLTKNSPKITTLSSSIVHNTRTITDPFAGEIGSGTTITSYHPDDSINVFIESRQGSIASQNLIKKAFSRVPVSNERPFLTIINFKNLKVSSPRFINRAELENFPLFASINNLSDHIYFTITSENLTSFNYFELPRSFVANDLKTSSSKKTFSRSDIQYQNNNTEFFEVYDLKIYIWAVYGELGIKNISTILDKYFRTIKFSQNDQSLFNFNLVECEFKNGSEIQAPLSNFDSVSIDTEYKQMLYGAFKSTNSFTPSSTIGAGGIQRLTQLCGNSQSCPPVNLSIETETSDDIRYIRTWPLEYDCKGNPFVISNARVNYNQFDKTSASRTQQEAVPITHYIANENVEQVYVTLGIDQLFDTNHIDMISMNPLICGTKSLTSADVLDGVGTYAQLPGNYVFPGSEKKYLYILVFRTDNTSLLLDASRDPNRLLDNLKILNPILAPISIESPMTYVPPSLFSKNFRGPKNTYYLWNLDNAAADKTINYDIYTYTLPNPYKDFNPNFNLNDFLNNPKALEAKLKMVDDNNSPFYCFNLNSNETIINDGYYLYNINELNASDNAILNSISTPYNRNAFFTTYRVAFLSPRQDQLSLKAIAGTSIQHLIPWTRSASGIFNLVLISNSPSTYRLQYQSSFNPSNYPYIKKYLLDSLPIIPDGTFSDILNNYLYKVPLFVLGFNIQAINLKSSWFSGGLLTLEALENLINLYVVKNNNIPLDFIPKLIKGQEYSRSYGSKVFNDIGSNAAFENILNKFENGRLLGGSSVYNIEIRSQYTNDIKYANDQNSYKASIAYLIGDYKFDLYVYSQSLFKEVYNASNVYLLDKTKTDIDPTFDFLVLYNLYENNSMTASSKIDSISTFQKITRSDDGQITTVSGFDFSTVKQQITAGTKLPAIVSVKVETGYENCDSKLIGDYYSYKYDIFGIGGQTFVDLGRKCYPYVYAQQMNAKNTPSYGTTRLEIPMKFWLFHNTLTKTGSFVYMKGTPNNFYAELYCSCINEINMGQFFSGYNTPFQISNSSYMAGASRGNAGTKTYRFIDFGANNKDVYAKSYGDIFSQNQPLISGVWRFIPGINYITAGADWTNLNPGILCFRSDDGKIIRHSPYYFCASNDYTMSFASLGSQKTYVATQSVFTNMRQTEWGRIQNLPPSEYPVDLKLIGELLLEASIIPPNLFLKGDPLPVFSCSLPLYDLTGNKVIENGFKISFYDITYTNIRDEYNYYSPSSSDQILLPPPKTDSNGRSIRRFVKVTKLSHETLSSLIQKQINLNKVTEIIPQRFSYPFSAIVGTKIDSRSFGQVPNRTFDVKLKKVLVPSNYYPLDLDGEDIRYIKSKSGNTQIYIGDWDGSFKLSWTNNPAWVLMDMLVNKRYGLGSYIEPNQVDIWELYKIARWCDKVDDNGIYYGVPDTYGGIEPRFTFNVLIREKFNLFDMINQIASVFRGSVYYMNSMITFDADRIKPPIGEFTNLDVKDGIFNYTNFKKDEEFTVADVSYIDSKDNFKPKIEYVEDSDGIRQRGILKKTINSLGTTSRGQARRIGKHFLYQVGKENTNVSFSTDLKALLYKPGDLIYVKDELVNANKNFGYVKDIDVIDSTSFKVVIDELLNTGIYNKNEITLYTPIAKPKMEDMEFYLSKTPNSFTVNGSFLNLFARKGGTNNTYATFGVDLGLYNYVKYNLPEEYYEEWTEGVRQSYVLTNTESKASRFTTSLSPISIYAIDVVYQYAKPIPNTYTPDPASKVYIRESTRLTFRYLANQDLENNYSENGVWELCNDFVSVKLTTSNKSLQYSIPNPPYYWENFDIGVFCLLNTVGGYATADYRQPIFFKFDGNRIINGAFAQPNAINITNYNSSAINIFDLYQSDKPSIETFYITGFSTGKYEQNGVYNEYSELYVTTSGRRVIQDYFSQGNSNLDYSVDSFSTTKTSFPIAEIPIGSTYSLNILNKKDKIFKINSIQENYINEYNITATEYNSAKFKEIEEGAYIDDLESSFNYISAYNSSTKTLKANFLDAPIITNFSWSPTSNFQLAGSSLYAEWLPVVGATKYKIYILTPSKQTQNYTSEVDASELSSTKRFSKFFNLSPLEQGTYTLVVQAYAPFVNEAPSVAGNLYSFSAESKRTVNVFAY